MISCCCSLGKWRTSPIFVSIQLRYESEISVWSLPVVVCPKLITVSNHVLKLIIVLFTLWVGF